jgi:hypothetical protein
MVCTHMSLYDHADVGRVSAGAQFLVNCQHQIRRVDRQPVVAHMVKRRR